MTVVLRYENVPSRGIFTADFDSVQECFDWLSSYGNHHNIVLRHIGDGTEPTCDYCARAEMHTPDLEWNGETGMHVICEIRMGVRQDGE